MPDQQLEFHSNPGVISREITCSDFHLQRMTLTAGGFAGRPMYSRMVGAERHLEAYKCQLCDSRRRKWGQGAVSGFGANLFNNHWICWYWGWGIERTQGCPLSSLAGQVNHSSPRRREADLEVYRSEQELLAPQSRRTQARHTACPCPHRSGPLGDQLPFHQAFIMLALKTKCVAQHFVHIYVWGCVCGCPTDTQFP